MKTLSQTVSHFASTSYCLIVFLFCQHFRLLSHFEIIRCIVKSLIATSTYFSLKYNWKKKTWKVFFRRQSLGAQTGIPVSQTAWIRHWIPPENVKKPLVFWCFKGKGNINLKWINTYLSNWLWSDHSFCDTSFIFSAGLSFALKNKSQASSHDV